MDDVKEGRSALRVRVAMYWGALAAGVLLILVGKVSPVEASGYVAPFLVLFERINQRL
ncbi:hypothetical protein ACFXKJ_01930 [Kitasatospora indigofera]|uniref:hypothetical protein n=1 Tax=Kitasatospora indigofera TaxID=67307 RepID=UPI0036AD2144